MFFFLAFRPGFKGCQRAGSGGRHSDGADRPKGLTSPPGLEDGPEQRPRAAARRGAGASNRGP